MLGRTNARDLQHMRRIHCTAGQDHFPSRADLLEHTALAEFRAHAALAVKQKPRDLGFGFHPHLVTRLRKISTRRRTAPAANARHLRIANAFLFHAVQILAEGMARLLRRFNEAMGQWQNGAVIFHLQRSILAAHGRVAAIAIGFAATKQRQHFIIAPAAAAHLRPKIEIGRIAAHVKHPIDGRSAAQRAPARPADFAIIGARFSFGRVAPIHQLLILHQLQHAGGDMNPRMAILRAGFQQRHAPPGHAKPACHHTAG